LVFVPDFRMVARGALSEIELENKSRRIAARSGI
jgi:hypothetical protein